MTTNEAKKIQPGATLVYNDGRAGHTAAPCQVLSVAKSGMVVQFNDRADATRISFTDAGWMPFLTIQAQPAPAKFSARNPRFVWNIGAISEVYPDMQNVSGMVLWDRQEQKPVVTVGPEYGNAICLETTNPDDGPFTRLESWFNGIDNDCLESEGITPTK